MTTETPTEPFYGSAQRVAAILAGQHLSAIAAHGRAQAAVEETYQKLRALEQERSVEEAAGDARLRELQGLIRAIANADRPITLEVDKYGQDRYETTFATAVVFRRNTSGTASKVLGQITTNRPDRERNGTFTSPDPGKGTNESIKLQKQVNEARAWVEEHLQEYTASAYLTELGVDLKRLPKVEDLITFEIGTKTVGGGGYGGSYRKPVWLAKVRDVVVAQIESTWEISDLLADRRDPEHAGHSDENHRNGRGAIDAAFSAADAEDKIEALAEQYLPAAKELLLYRLTGIKP